MKRDKKKTKSKLNETPEILNDKSAVEKEMDEKLFRLRLDICVE